MADGSLIAFGTHHAGVMLVLDGGEMGIKPATPGADVRWAPLPGGWWRLEVSDGKLVPSTRPDWIDQVQFSLRVPETEKAKLQQIGQALAEGEGQSELTTFRAGATLNGFRGGTYTPTRLAAFVAALFGAELEAEIEKAIRDGWSWPGATDDDPAHCTAGLALFRGLALHVRVEHEPPKQDGRIWTRATMPTPIGAVAPDPAYQEYARQRWAEISSATAMAAPVGSPTVQDDEAAALEQRAAEMSRQAAERRAADRPAAGPAPAKAPPNSGRLLEVGMQRIAAAEDASALADFERKLEAARGQLTPEHYGDLLEAVKSRIQELSGPAESADEDELPW